jgi:hypothetical protein
VLGWVWSGGVQLGPWAATGFGGRWPRPAPGLAPPPLFRTGGWHSPFQRTLSSGKVAVEVTAGASGSNTGAGENARSWITSKRSCQGDQSEI